MLADPFSATPAALAPRERLVTEWPAVRWPATELVAGGHVPAVHLHATGTQDGGDGTAQDAPDLSGRRVLLVEDETFLALDIQYELTDARAQVIGPVARLEEGLAALAALEADGHLPDAAILDVNLCGVDVFPLADALAARGVPFLFHTAHGNRGEFDGRFRDVPICAKPMDADLLVAQVARMLRRHN